MFCISVMATLSKFANAHKKYGRSHDDARCVVCCVCAKKLKDGKGGRSVINKRLEDLVRLHVYKDYSVCNTAYPTAICGSCRVTLNCLEKVLFKKINCILTNYLRTPRVQDANFPLS